MSKEAMSLLEQQQQCGDADSWARARNREAG